MTEEEVIKLIEKYRDEKCTALEQSHLEQAYLNFSRKYSDTPFPDDLWIRKEAGLSNIFSNSEPEPKMIPLFKKMGWVGVAAAVIILLNLGFYFYHNNFDKKKSGVAIVKNDIAPGGNKAYLTLSDGKRVSLTDAVNGNIANQSGVTITKTNDGTLVYEVAESAKTNLPNIITTPNGGKWQVRLPDGSTVWLNSASTLIYPTSFKGCKERKVELTGEAYFEVSKDSSSPFIVVTDFQQIKVLGTHFNVMAYGDGPDCEATLLEGSVLVTSRTHRGSSFNEDNGKLLKPGQQAKLIHNESSSFMTIRDVNTEEIVAWKDGLFSFNNTAFEKAMEQISRWYNAEIVYDGERPVITLTGVIPRNSQLSKILNVLESSGGVKFDINGNKIIVKSLTK